MFESCFVRMTEVANKRHQDMLNVDQGFQRIVDVHCAFGICLFKSNITYA